MRCNQLGLTIYSCLATRVTNALRKWCEWQVWTWHFFILEIRISGIVRLGAAACWILVCRLNSCIFLYAKDKPEPPSLNNCHSWIFLVDCVRHVWTHTQITRLFSRSIGSFSILVKSEIFKYRTESHTVKTDSKPEITDSTSESSICSATHHPPNHIKFDHVFLTLSSCKFYRPYFHQMRPTLNSISTQQRVWSNKHVFVDIPVLTYHRFPVCFQSRTNGLILV